jgi:hypothetical protein
LTGASATGDTLIKNNILTDFKNRIAAALA